MAKDTLPSFYEAFIELCTEKPVEKITITDVAEKCGISRKTFYYHFTDVASLVEAVVDNELSRIAPLFTDTKPASEILYTGCEMIQERREPIMNVLNSCYVGVIRTKLHDFLVVSCRPVILGYAKGTLYTEDDIDRIVSLFVVIIMGYLTKWFLMGMGVPNKVVIDKSLKMFSNAIPFMINNVSRDEMHIRFDDKSSVLRFDATEQ